MHTVQRPTASPPIMRVHHARSDHSVRSPNPMQRPSHAPSTSTGLAGIQGTLINPLPYTWRKQLPAATPNISGDAVKLCGHTAIKGAWYLKVIFINAYSTCDSPQVDKTRPTNRLIQVRREDNKKQVPEQLISEKKTCRVKCQKTLLDVSTKSICSPRHTIVPHAHHRQLLIFYNSQVVQIVQVQRR
jgi:hypothetical protein